MKKSTIIATVVAGVGTAIFKYGLSIMDKYTNYLKRTEMPIQKYSKELFHGDLKEDNDDDDIVITQREVSVEEVPEEFLKRAMQHQIEDESIRTLSIDDVEAKN